MNAQEALQAYDELYKSPRTGEIIIDGDEAQVAADLANALRDELNRSQRLAEWNATLRAQIVETRGSILQSLRVFQYEEYTAENIYFSKRAQDFLPERIIQAIKQLRDDNPGLGLGDAKRFIDNITGRDSFPSRPGS